MKTLKTLIRFHQQQLDGLRREMTSLESQKVQLLQLTDRLEKELQHELKLAEKSPEMSYFFGDFATRIRRRQDNIRTEVKKLDKQMDELRDRIRDALAERKKYEIVKERREEEQRQEEKRKETAEFDEVAGNRHRRKGNVIARNEATKQSS